MPRVTWNDDKNLWLQEHRGISFEDVVAHIEAGNIVTVLEHPNPAHTGQQIAVVVIDDYAWAVLHRRDGDEMVLITAFPGRTLTRRWCRSDDNA